MGTKVQNLNFSSQLKITQETVKDTNDQADEALEFSKESWFRMHHEIAAATVFRELLGSKLTERQISYELARRGYTYTETA